MRCPTIGKVEVRGLKIDSCLKSCYLSPDEENAKACDFECGRHFNFEQAILGNLLRGELQGVGSCRRSFNRRNGNSEADS